MTDVIWFRFEEFDMPCNCPSCRAMRGGVALLPWTDEDVKFWTQVRLGRKVTYEPWKDVASFFV